MACELPCPADAPRLHVALLATKPIRGGASSLGHVIRQMGNALGRRHDVTTVLAPVSYWSIAQGAVQCATANRDIPSWREATLFSPQVVRAQSRRARAALQQVQPQAEVALQIGGMFSPFADRRQAGSVPPLCLWIDCSFHPDVVHNVSWGPRRLRQAFYAFQKELYARSCFVFTISEWARQQALEWHRLPPERVVAVGGGMNTALPAAPSPMVDGPPSLLFVGTEFRRKGVDYLLQAFRVMRDRVPDAVLHLVGQPKDMRLPSVLPRGVEYHGPIHHRATLDELFRRSTALVLPSRMEPLGHVILESFAFARPVVASRICAIPEWVVDGETGYTVCVGDTDILAQRCIELLLDPDLAARMGRAGYERVRRDGTWEAVVSRMVPYLRRAANEGGGKEHRAP